MDSSLWHRLLPEKESSLPLYRQVAEGILHLAEEGQMKANEKLPPIRTLAAALGVNPSTVAAAYRYLEQKKAVYSRVGSGTFLSPIPLTELPEERTKFPVSMWKRPVLAEGAVNFTDTSLPPELFPTDAFRQAINTLLEEEQGAAFGRMDIQGYYPLREAVCRFLEDYGIRTWPENIQILSGAQQGLDVVSKAMMKYGDVIFTERPTFYGAVGAFLGRGCQVVEISMEKDGVDLVELETMAKLYHPRFFYMMAYFQTPTGVTYSAKKKRKLLELAEKYDFFLVEDDNLYDFCYHDQTITPMKAIDHRGRVIYLKSLSKILMPGLRMGFAVFPRKMLLQMMEAKYTTDIATSGFLQKALTRYLEENCWQDHIARIRAYGRAQYRMAVKYAERYLADTFSFLRPEGGLSLWLTPRGFSAEEALHRAAREQIFLSPGSQFDLGTEESQALRLSFIHTPEGKMESGIRRLGRIANALQQEGKGELTLEK